MSSQQGATRRFRTSDPSPASSQWSVVANYGDDSGSSQSQIQTPSQQDEMQVDNASVNTLVGIERGITGDTTAVNNTFSDHTQHRRFQARENDTARSSDDHPLRHRRPEALRQNSRQDNNDIKLEGETEHDGSPDNSSKEIRFPSRRTSPMRDTFRVISAPAGLLAVQDFQMIGSQYEQEGPRNRNLRIRRVRTY